MFCVLSLLFHGFIVILQSKPEAYNGLNGRNTYLLTRVE